MKKMLTMSLVALSLLFIGCASGYKEVVPNTQNYLSSVEKSGILFEYKYDVLKKKKIL